MTSIEQATINANGTLGAFTTAGIPTLTTARNYPTAVTIGNYPYVIGGYNGGSGYLSSIERTTLQ